MDALTVEGFTQMTDQSLKMDFRESLEYTNKWLLTNYISISCNVIQDQLGIFGYLIIVGLVLYSDTEGHP